MDKFLREKSKTYGLLTTATNNVSLAIFSVIDYQRNLNYRVEKLRKCQINLYIP